MCPVACGGEHPFDGVDAVDVHDGEDVGLVVVAEGAVGIHDWMSRLSPVLSSSCTSSHISSGVREPSLVR